MVGAVIGFGDAAMFAGRDIAAVGTEETGGEPAPVQEQDALFAFLETIDEFIGEEGGDRGTFGASALSLAAHIDEVNTGQFTMVNAFQEAVDGIFATLDIVEGFKGRRGGTDEAYRTGEVGAVDRHVASVVAGIIFLFVGGFVLLIYDHEFEVLHGGKYGGARAHHDVGLATDKGFP
jgi:hypothetical protein